MTDRSAARLLDDALTADGARPLLTWYDDGTGERIELSVATFANWVAKTAGLLADGLDTQPGDHVRLALPPDHWLAAVWAAAAWRVGAVVTPDPDAAAVVVVTGPAGVAADGAPGGPGGAEVVAVSLRPLAAPFLPGTLPDGALDYAREVPSYPDRCTLPWPAADAPALVVGGTELGGLALVARARDTAASWGLGPAGRLLVEAGEPGTDTPKDAADLLLAVTVVPLVVGGSCVLVRAADPARTPARVEQERVTVATRWPFEAHWPFQAS